MVVEYDYRQFTDKLGRIVHVAKAMTRSTWDGLQKDGRRNKVPEGGHTHARENARRARQLEKLSESERQKIMYHELKGS